MVSRYRRLMLRPGFCFPDLVNSKNSSAAIADEHLTAAVEGQPSRHPEVASKSNELVLSRYAVDGSVEPARDEHSRRSPESDTRRIHHVAGKLFDRAVTGDAKNRDGHVFAA